MSDVAIKVEGLGKRFAIGAREQRKNFREMVSSALEAPFRMLSRKREDPATILWALKDVNFEVKRGEAVGIIGRNGAGKSTLLKVLSRITDPTEGQIEINGRIGSLLEVGTGFHPELTGRENIFMNGAILGMRRAEIVRKFDEIVAFAEVERFIDTPVKRYSSGMYTRLAFAVAAHLEPEILIVDEVLAVGDSQFQKKCLGKMGEVAKGGRTVLFVSHNIAAIQALCTQGVLLKSGQVECKGNVATVVAGYIAQMESASTVDVGDRVDRAGSGSIRCRHLRILGSDGHDAMLVTPGESFQIEVGYVAKRDLKGVGVSIDVESNDGTRVTTLYSGYSQDLFEVAAGPGVLKCAVQELNLRPDRYHINIMLHDGESTADFVGHALPLEVGPTDFYGTGRLPERAHGALLCRFKWSTHACAREPAEARLQ